MHFNPRSREESDVHVLITQQLVSNFNPRSREGSDNRLEAVWMKTEIFQSTLPRGERHLRREIQRQFIHNFNPRSREGSDAFFHQFDCISMISIRAPARGATHSPIQGMLPYLFQSALPRGERLFSVHTFCRYLSFQSALPRGERRIWLSALSRRNNFNPRSREGSDSVSARNGKNSTRFQSALPRGERLYHPNCRKKR